MDWPAITPPCPRTVRGTAVYELEKPPLVVAPYRTLQEIRIDHEFTRPIEILIRVVGAIDRERSSDSAPNIGGPIDVHRPAHIPVRERGGVQVRLPSRFRIEHQPADRNLGRAGQTDPRSRGRPIVVQASRQGAVR